MAHAAVFSCWSASGVACSTISKLTIPIAIKLWFRNSVSASSGSPFLEFRVFYGHGLRTPAELFCRPPNRIQGPQRLNEKSGEGASPSKFQIRLAPANPLCNLPDAAPACPPAQKENKT